eukprot:NODE_646_length_5050_cov_1.281155.p2 type:complete len:183 gc:universal NODE_646_length_5050_cov_1.281155:3055-2507(-)
MSLHRSIKSENPKIIVKSGILVARAQPEKYLTFLFIKVLILVANFRLGLWILRQFSIIGEINVWKSLTSAPELNALLNMLQYLYIFNFSSARFKFVSTCFSRSTPFWEKTCPSKISSSASSMRDLSGPTCNESPILSNLVLISSLISLISARLAQELISSAYKPRKQSGRSILPRASSLVLV